MSDEIINGLKKNLEEVPEKFLKLSGEKLSSFPAPGKWSKKQILGHLCDSALNNYSRFIRVQYETEPFDIRGYQQNEWVEYNDYQNIPPEEIVRLWTVLNKRIVNIISRIPADKLMMKCDTGEGELYELDFIISDYLSHMNHHLEQIFG